MKVDIPKGWEKYFEELKRELNMAFPEVEIGDSEVLLFLLREERCRAAEDRFVDVEFPKW